MNILLAAANGALAYRRGRQTGIWGLVGLGIALLAVYNWNYIQPIFEAIGLVSLLSKLGLIVPNEPGITGYKIVFISALNLRNTDNWSGLLGNLFVCSDVCTE